MVNQMIQKRMWVRNQELFVMITNLEVTTPMQKQCAN
jgi:hypothetical protein